jgi:hypothetical protein
MDEIAFLAVNETRQMVNFDRAMLWLPWQRRVRAVSGVAAVERTAPFTQWANRVARHISRRRRADDFIMVTEEQLPRKLREDYAEWSQGSLLWLPLRIDDATRDGGLMLMRSEPFDDSEIQVVVRLAATFSHAFSLLRLRRRGAGKRRSKRIFGRIWLPLVVGASIAALFIPVSLTILVPAQVVPANPYFVSAPIDGVVERILVQPNQIVRTDQVLILLEETELRARLSVTDSTVAAAVAELSRAQQRAFTDLRSKADLQLLQAKLDEKRTERDYAAARLGWAKIRAPADGISIYNDPTDWVGRPVSVGERIMTVADPAEVRLDVWIPAGDAVSLPPRARVLFFQNVAPEAPVEAELTLVSYEAQARPDGTAAHRGKATFAAGAASPRLGLTGTAKIHGEKVSLMYLIIRRPLATLRRWVGI